MRNLTTKELHLLIVIMTGDLSPDIRGVKIMKLKQEKGIANTVAVVWGYSSKWPIMTSRAPHCKKIKQILVDALFRMNLIFLIPAKRERYKYTGQWIINKEVLKKHPQYNEIRAQAVLGT